MAYIELVDRITEGSEDLTEPQLKDKESAA